MKRFQWTLVAIPFTVVAMTICMFLMGAGHGTYRPAIWTFPFGMLRAASINQIDDISLLLGALQYPFYGTIIDVTKETKWSTRAGLTLLFAHILTIVYVTASANSFLE